jgi:hypothetical protein
MTPTTDLIRIRRSGYPGTCATCLTRYEVGSDILWNRTTRVTFHADEALCERLHAVKAAERIVAPDPVFDAMCDDDREMALMEMRADREQSAREGDWMNGLDAMTDAAMDLAAIEREEEMEGEHRMNCNDKDCLDRGCLDRGRVRANWPNPNDHDAWAREDEIWAEYEAIQDRIDRAFREEYPRWRRLRNVRTLSRGVYSVNGVNLKITPNPRDPQGFKFAIAEEDGGLGRVTGNGMVYTWDPINDHDERVKAALAALDTLLNSERPGEYGKVHAQATASCYRCGEALVDKEKNPYYPYLGPVCGKKISKGER